MDLVLQVSNGLTTSLPTDSRVFGTQTRILEATKFALGDSLDLGVILEEEDELWSIIDRKLEERVTKIGVMGDIGKFKIIWGSTDLGGGDT